MEPVNDSKTTNAIVALIREKARSQGRNETAAEEFVLSNLNLNADQAKKKYGVIEYVAASPEELLGQINGSRAKNITLNTTQAGIEQFGVPLNLRLLKALSIPGRDSDAGGALCPLHIQPVQPRPGLELLGVVGPGIGSHRPGIQCQRRSHIPDFAGLGAGSSLSCTVTPSASWPWPVSYASWWAAFCCSHQLSRRGGAVPGGYQRSMAMAIILPSLILAAFVAFAMYKVAKARFAPWHRGRLVGETAEALDRLDPGWVCDLQGEYWRAEAEEPVEKGERVW